MIRLVLILIGLLVSTLPFSPITRVANASDPQPSLVVCTPQADGEDRSVLEETGWLCLDMAPGIGNLGGELLGTKFRLASAEQHWEAFENGQLWTTLAAQNGWVEGDSFVENLGNVLSANWDGLKEDMTCIAETNWARAKDPLGTAQSFCTGVSLVLTQVVQDALITPARGVFAGLGLPVTPPTNREWAGAYMAVPTAFAPLARTGMAATLTTRAQETVQALGQTVRTLSDDMLRGGGTGADGLCFAGAGAGGREIPICVQRLEIPLNAFFGFRTPGDFGRWAKPENFPIATRLPAARFRPTGKLPANREGILEELRNIRTRILENQASTTDLDVFQVIGQEIRKRYNKPDPALNSAVHEVLEAVEGKIPPGAWGELLCDTLHPQVLLEYLETMVGKGSRLKLPQFQIDLLDRALARLNSPPMHPYLDTSALGRIRSLREIRTRVVVEP